MKHEPFVPRTEVTPMFAEIKKADAALQIVWAEVYIPNIPDSQGDFMTADEIRKMAHQFLKDGNTNMVDIEHDNNLYGMHVVESFIARKGDEDFIDGAWVAAIHIPATEIWELVEKHELNGFSMQAFGHTTSTKIEVEVPLVLTGTTDLVDNHAHDFRVSFSEGGQLLGGETTVTNNHRHAIRRGTVTEPGGEDGHVHRFNAVDGLV